MKITIGELVVKKDEGKFWKQAIINPIGAETQEHTWFEIRVDQHMDVIDNWGEAEVRWASYGGQSAEISRAFGKGIIEAANIADQMNKNRKGDQDES